MSDIFELTRLCHRGFQDLVTNLPFADHEHLNQLPLSSIQTQSGKFKIWCGNLGALQLGFASLDYRLRESTVMRTNVTEVLQQLNSTLVACIDVIAERRPPFEEQFLPSDSSDLDSSTDDSENGGSADAKKELPMRLSAIVNILNDLYKLGYKVRDPRLRPSSDKAILLSEKDPESGVDLLDQFSIFDGRHVEELLDELRRGRDAPSNVSETLPQRLATAITLRRKYFRYWERHSKKLSQSHLNATTKNSLNAPRVVGPRDKANLRYSSEGGGPTKELSKPRLANQKGEETVVSKTEATLFDPAHDGDTEKGSVISLASTALDDDGKGVELPLPPSKATRGEEFVCPYCRVLCPPRQGRGKTWKSHVLHDLQPYICTYDGCSQPNKLYRSRRQWLEHEESTHRSIWRCQDHPDSVFSSPADFRNHLSHEHEGVTKQKIEGLVSLLSSVLVDGRKSCPICFQDAPFPRGLTSHIANHLERIALFALPVSSSETDDDIGGKRSIFASRGSSDTDQMSHDVDDHETRITNSNVPVPPRILQSSPVSQAAGQLLDMMLSYRGRNGTDNVRPNYLPKQKLEEFWLLSKIRDVLLSIMVDLDPAIVREKFIRGFSLLVAVQGLSHLHLFIGGPADFFWDEDFPLHHIPHWWPDDPNSHKLFDVIHEHQWKFFPFFLDHGRLHNQVLDSAYILPIGEEETIHESDQHTISKIRVEPACSNFGQSTLVRKTYHEASSREYDREIKAFASLQDAHAAGIVRCYGFYRQMRKDGTMTNNLLLEYIDAGNLRDLLKSKRSPQTLTQIIELWTSFLGVLEGLAFLHCSVDSNNVKHQRIHQDIKPENLLVSAKERADSSYAFDIKLTDFGFSHTMTLKDSQDDNSGVDFHGGQTYGKGLCLALLYKMLTSSQGAPEYSHHEKETHQGLQRMTTAADIWSLGCVLSETAAWVAHGKRGPMDYWESRVNELNTLVNFNGSGHDGFFHDGSQTLRAVHSMHERILKSVARFDTLTPKIVTMTQNHMLCPQNSRMAAHMLHAELCRIIETAWEGYQGVVTSASQDQEQDQASIFETTESVDAFGLSVNHPNTGAMVTDWFPDYQLRKSDLLSYLIMVFPKHKYQVLVEKEGTGYMLTIPEKLTKVRTRVIYDVLALSHVSHNVN
ncbi:hypothetical protein FZEAL_4626 [Fusarium zealandicum]|uniref:Protein kinase domain-containing protein n=1 Tax=Fusarium zealandicum TaxID=1053134 RepID=A0A8H4ULW2_9HYPO|nr:hypothetical protein FZEAL_4626 [Fusarium zealandicum]